MTAQNLTAAELVASWKPVVSPREQALRAIVSENPEGNDRVTASIILDAREAAAKRAGCVHSPDRLYAWRAVDGVQCVCCCDCGAVLAGAA